MSFQSSVFVLDIGFQRLVLFFSVDLFYLAAKNSVKVYFKKKTCHGFIKELVLGYSDNTIGSWKTLLRHFLICGYHSP